VGAARGDRVAGGIDYVGSAPQGVWGDGGDKEPTTDGLYTPVEVVDVERSSGRMRGDHCDGEPARMRRQRGWS
jgi:hypothetical protein